MNNKAVPAGRQGFTLIELIVALTLASMLFIAGMFSFLNYMKTYDRVSREAELAQVRQSVLLRMTREIRSADQILASTPDRIQIKSDKSVISYYRYDNKIRRVENSYASYLTEPGQIKKLAFLYPAKGLVMITVDQDTTEVYCRNEK